MNENNEYLYESDNDYEDFDSENEYYNPETYYLTDQQLDELIYQLQNAAPHTHFKKLKHSYAHRTKLKSTNGVKA